MTSSTVARLNSSAVVGSTATTDAERARPSSTASSPSTAHSPSVTRTASSPVSELKTTLTRPPHTTSSVSPGSPWYKTY